MSKNEVVAEDYIRTGHWVPFGEAVTMLPSYSEGQLAYRCKLGDLKTMTVGKVKLVETDSLLAFVDDMSLELVDPPFSKWDMVRTGKWKSVEEAAEYLDMTRHQVYYNIRQERLLAVDMDNMILISTESLENFTDINT